MNWSRLRRMLSVAICVALLASGLTSVAPAGLADAATGGAPVIAGDIDRTHGTGEHAMLPGGTHGHVCDLHCFVCKGAPELTVWRVDNRQFVLRDDLLEGRLLEPDFRPPRLRV